MSQVCIYQKSYELDSLVTDFAFLKVQTEPIFNHFGDDFVDVTNVIINHI
jgi:hypothetical protein